MPRAILLSLVALLIEAVSLTGQVSPDSVKHRNDCRLAAQVIETGRPAPHMEWALAHIGSCGSGARGLAHAAAVRRLRAVQDTTTLRSFWEPSTYLRDRNLYEAAVEIAADPSASAQSRVFAFLTLVRYSVPSSRAASYSTLVGGFYEVGGLRGVVGGCAPGVVSEGWSEIGAPLPSDFGAEIRAAARTVLADRSAPLDVQTAATCAASLAPTPE